jgi:hypothetical protein
MDEMAREKAQEAFLFFGNAVLIIFFFVFGESGWCASGFWEHHLRRRCNHTTKGWLWLGGIWSFDIWLLRKCFF